ncbi:MAG: N-acetylmuramoyl-L-alanine amidase [Phascolarctobacterium sp.]|nr:N-acetylmuramoyl-L-alanine amidase [Phascolarctobacterium sp.]
MKIFINPGHDLTCDPGACGHGLKEANVVSEVARHLENYLAALGHDVVMNVQDDDLAYVCAAANASACDIFISIHCNAALNIWANGTETFACSNKGQKLAACVQRSIVDALDTADRGVKYANFYVLKHTSMPAILVELAFITSEEDAQLLATRQEEFARAIARGIEMAAKKLSAGSFYSS